MSVALGTWSLARHNSANTSSQRSSPSDEKGCIQVGLGDLRVARFVISFRWEVMEVFQDGRARE